MKETLSRISRVHTLASLELAPIVNLWCVRVHFFVFLPSRHDDNDSDEYGECYDDGDDDGGDAKF